MSTQSFLYNAIFFTYGLVLEFFFHVKATDTGYYFLAFAAGNLLGPLTIGRLFDTIGRKKMISGTYILSGVLLAISAVLFKNGSLNATTQTLCWVVVFFFASAGASAGYLTASEVFPLEVRAKAIAVFFAIAQCFGAFGSAWYGHLIGTGRTGTRCSSATSSARWRWSSAASRRSSSASTRRAGPSRTWPRRCPSSPSRRRPSSAAGGS